MVGTGRRTRPNRKRRRASAVGICASLALLVSAAPAAAQSVELAEFGGQTFNQPFFVAGDPNDPSRVFVVEGDGAIRLVEDGDTQPTAFLTIPRGVHRMWSTAACSRWRSPPTTRRAGCSTSSTRAMRGSRPTEYYLRLEEFRRSAANPDLADPASRRVVLEIPHLEDRPVTREASCSSGPTACSTSPSATAGRKGIRTATAKARGRCTASCCGSTPPGPPLATTRSPPTTRSRARHPARTRSTPTGCATRGGSPSIASPAT